MNKIFAFLSFLFPIMCFAQDKILKWDLYHPLKKELITFGTHGSVQELLIKTGELPDPFYGQNETQFLWIEKYDWEFTSVLEISEKQLGNDFIELEFPGIDTYAKVYLNDLLILEASNSFRPYRIQVKDKVKTGKNQLRVVFTSPVNYHRKDYEARTTKLPTPNDVGEIGISSLSRKPQYQFGWDWALRMNTIGFIKPVKVHTYNYNRIVLQKVDTKMIEEKEAILNLTVICSVEKTEKINLKSKIWGEFKDFQMTNGVVNIPTAIANPKLWWPRGQGDQYLYQDTWILTNAQGIAIDSVEIRFGIKTSELIQQKDDWGTSFYLRINGRAIFCKGANYIPQEVFPSAVTEKSVQDLVKQMEKSNFNMVRIWGGGYYSEEALLEACDEAGIMVWHDLMFACAVYPGDETFLKNVREELNYQVPRIAAHPSVVIFNGNNEVDVAWKNWGFQLKYMIGPKTQKEIEQDYINLFQKLAPEVVSTYSSIPYEHTSPLSNWGKDEFYNHGTQHYWGVWHGKDPIEDFGLKSGRFNAEYGFQSFPEYSTLLTFSTKKDWNLNSDVMKHHQKSYVGNGMIKKHADILYGNAETFEDFVYYSQLTQAKSVGIAISSHRIGSPRCMGTLYWQLNDCWPAPTWSSIDYYGNWKALQYQVKNDFEDVAILEQTEKIGEEKYFLVSDQPDSFVTNLKYEIFDLDGKLLKAINESLFIPGNWKQDICMECRTAEFMDRNYVIVFTWQKVNGELLTRSFAHLPKKRKKAPVQNVSFQLINIDPDKKTATLKINTPSFLKDFWIYSSKTGIRFDRNFLQLLPGTHEIQIYFDTLPSAADFGMKWL